MWSRNLSKSAWFMKNTIVKTKENPLYSMFCQFSSMLLCDQQRDEERKKIADTCKIPPHFWVQDVSYHSFGAK